MRRVVALVHEGDKLRYTHVASLQVEQLNLQIFASGYPDDAACPYYPAVVKQYQIAERLCGGY
jgi:hypothetical protein